MCFVRSLSADISAVICSGLPANLDMLASSLKVLILKETEISSVPVTVMRLINLEVLVSDYIQKVIQDTYI